MNRMIFIFVISFTLKLGANATTFYPIDIFVSENDNTGIYLDKASLLTYKNDKLKKEEEKKTDEYLIERFNEYIGNTKVIELKQITVTIKNSESVNFGMVGTGTMSIDWGDFSERIYVLNDTLSFYRHKYSNKAERTITITGGNITHFYCVYNSITDLDVSKSTALTMLHCGYNQLTNLDLSKNTTLEELYCLRNQLTILDLSKNTALKKLYCSRNQLTILDLSENIALIELNCDNNKLTKLNIGKNSELTKLSCNFNYLTNLDVSNCIRLKELICCRNRLTKLDVSKNVELIHLFCCENELTAVALNKLFKTLNNNTALRKEVGICDNPGADKCDKNIATSKGWVVNINEVIES